MRVENFPLNFPDKHLYVTTQLAYFAVYPKLEKMNNDEYRAIVALAKQGAPLPPDLKKFLSTTVKRPLVDPLSGQLLSEDYKQIILWHDAMRLEESKEKPGSAPGSMEHQSGFYGF